MPDLPEFLLQGRERRYLEWFFWNKTADPNAYAPADIEEYTRTYSAPGGMRAALAFYHAGALSAEQNRTLIARGRLAMPVLGLGANQGSIPGLAGALRPFVPSVQGDTIAGCGHFQPEEQAGAVAEALARFLGTLLHREL